MANSKLKPKPDCGGIKPYTLSLEKGGSGKAKSKPGKGKKKGSK